MEELIINILLLISSILGMYLYMSWTMDPISIWTLVINFLYTPNTTISLNEQFEIMVTTGYYLILGFGITGVGLWMFQKLVMGNDHGKHHKKGKGNDGLKASMTVSENQQNNDQGIGSVERGEQKESQSSGAHVVNTQNSAQNDENESSHKVNPSATPETSANQPQKLNTNTTTPNSSLESSPHHHHHSTSTSSPTTISSLIPKTVHISLKNSFYEFITFFCLYFYLIRNHDDSLSEKELILIPFWFLSGRFLYILGYILTTISEVNLKHYGITLTIFTYGIIIGLGLGYDMFELL